jgi:serine/threonine protein kinase/WD40 repeat protein
MSDLLRCREGHEWRESSECEPASETCPVCGARAGVDTTPDDTDDGFDGLSPPRQVPRRVDEFAGEVFRTIASSEPIEATNLPCVPGYELVERLGRGGMGVVYKARHLQLGRWVALKMIGSGSHADPRELARFRTEAEAAARLQHANIVQVYEVGEFNGCPFITLEFIDGGSLAQHIAGESPPAREAAQLVETLARAAAYAHQHGVVHRDLKPANILLAGAKHVTAGATISERPSALSARDLRFRAPKITDFGLAKRLDDGIGQTKTGELLGTPGYMAPEQVNGKTGPAVDIYALGAILYELLTGRPPFRAETAYETVQQIMREEPISPSRLRPRLARDLETICLKCLQKDPERRYESASALADDLHRFLADQPITARPAGWYERTHRWCRRNRIVATLMASVAGLMLALVSGSIVAALWWKKERDSAEYHRGQSEDAERRAVDKLWSASLAQAQAGRWSRRAGQRFASLEAIAQAARIRPSLELRNEAIACLTLIDLRMSRQWESAGASRAPVVAFDPNLERYAQGAEGGAVTIRDVATDREIKRIPGDDPAIRHLQFSLDGRYVAIVGSPKNPLRVWDLMDHQLVYASSEQVNGISAEFSPDNSRIAAGVADGSIRVVDLSSKRESHRLTDGPAATYLRFHPDSNQLAVVSATPHQIQIRSLDKSRAGPTMRHPAAIRCAAWSRDGRLIATGADDWNVYLWDARTGKQHHILRGHQGEIMRLEFSPNGHLLASVAWDGTVRLWDPWNGVQRISSVGAGWRSIQFDRTGTKLAYAQEGSKIGLWEIHGDAEWRPLYGHMGAKGPWGAAFSNDGRLLASVSRDGVRIWDVEISKELVHLPAGLTLGSFFHHPTGDLITAGSLGALRWPVRMDTSDNVGHFCIGPPQLVPGIPEGNLERGALSPDGRYMVVCSATRGGLVILLDLVEKRRINEFAHLNVFTVGVSSDGRWVASAARNGPGVKLWNTRTGKLECDLSTGAGYIAFSPDGKWLAVSGREEITLWEVGTWQRRWRVERQPANMLGPVAFSPDGLLAVALTQSVIHLVDPASGEQVAALETTDPVSHSALCFDQSGSRLAAVTASHAIHIWDLSRIREQLHTLGLDWDHPLNETRGSRLGNIRISVDPMTDKQLDAVKRLRELSRRFSD